MPSNHKFPLPAKRALFYGGAWHEARGKGTITVSSPSTGENLGVVANATREDVDDAIEAAAAAFPSWRDTPISERAKLVRKAASVLRAHAEELAYIDALDSGNPIKPMIVDVELSADYLEYFAGLASELKGHTIPLQPDVLNYTVREPLGVVARLGAFNHPLFFTASKTGAPLASGNTLVVKPADTTPLSTLRLAEIWSDVFPPGVFNVVTGGLEAGVALTENPKVAKIGLIGSIGAGRAVMKAASSTLKALSLELGGKNALIACEDANPELVAKAVVKGMNFFSVGGQSCGSTSRVFLHDAIHDAVLPLVTQIVSRIKLGLPTDPETEMGCLSSRGQFEKTMRYIEIGKDEGARLLTGGKRAVGPGLGDGYFVEPTIFADVTDTMTIAREEIFGPVLSILRWSDEDDVIARTNAVEQGLTASIFTQDLARGHRMAARIQAGYLWINDSSTHYVGVPFGGYKQSGFGKEEAFEEMVACTQVKNINVKLSA
ncbi:aldehyde dehydrogenase family protein [Mesorhizobium sp. BR1-1-13]|uniref:aldehyde dehydrogenase family protein n=1 Tax=Mesorhizobium sp. BR1-1-13 TaxID=2876656 RepID=UPI001CD0BD31|nr:aldehyde dehydrogenase family protein [Mesorhizobium sp. BR1-1-13]MBZ9942286.1 aldehyde dehydrogenase family protein [Mesorhizobium sp. BR1-1-13]